MTAKELGISPPRQPISARAAIEPLSPDPYDAPIELQKALRVCRSAVVLVVALELGVEGLLLLVHGACRSNKAQQQWYALEGQSYCLAWGWAEL